MSTIVPLRGNVPPVTDPDFRDALVVYRRAQRGLAECSGDVSRMEEWVKWADIIAALSRMWPSLPVDYIEQETGVKMEVGHVLDRPTR